MTSNAPQGRTESFKGKKRGRSEYEQQQAQAKAGANNSNNNNNNAAVKAGSARTRGVLLAFVDKALSNARLVSPSLTLIPSILNQGWIAYNEWR